VEEPFGRFCGYSRDAARCGACLASTWKLSTRFVEAWREASTGLLSAVDAVVYPSEFLRRQHAELFPAARPRLERVAAPPAPEAEHPDGAGVPRGSRPRRVAGDPFRIAFVGAYRPHKGALVFEDLLRREAGRSGRPVRWSILGSGDPERLRAARLLGAHVTGHYRAGGLVRRLREERIDVALLLSIWPESFAMTLSECRAAGVPVVAFAHGAMADRIAEEGGGLLVPPGNGADGVAAVLEEVLAGKRTIPPFHGSATGASAFRAAAERTDLYRTLLGEPT
jgi:glycosyltransferase involved in cell wall biosynthesis